MQKIGRKSFVIDMVIANQSNPAVPFVVEIQVNKNHGICNIVAGRRVPQEIVDSKTRKKRTVMRFFPVCHVGEVLSTFQGRQYNHPDTIECLKNALHKTLNRHE